MEFHHEQLNVFYIAIQYNVEPSLIFTREENSVQQINHRIIKSCVRTHAGNVTFYTSVHLEVFELASYPALCVRALNHKWSMEITS